MARPETPSHSPSFLKTLSRDLKIHYDRKYYGFEKPGNDHDALWRDLQDRVLKETGIAVGSDTLDWLIDGTGAIDSRTSYRPPADQIDALARYLAKAGASEGPVIPEPPYSEDQLDRIRVSLRLYKQRSGRSWKDVVWEILVRGGSEDLADASAQGERSLKDYENILLRFAVGFPKGKYSRIQDRAFMDLVLRFVLSDYPGLLKAEDLQPYKADFQAVLSLQHHLYSGLNGFVPPSGILAGSYRRLELWKGSLLARTMTIGAPDESGLLPVHEREEFFDRSVIHDYPGQNEDKRLAKASLRVYSGWAVLTPEDNLFFVMKRRGTGENRIYYTLAVNHEGEFTTGESQNGGEKSSVEELTLIHHDYPLVLSEADAPHPLQAIMSLTPFVQHNDHIVTEVQKHIRAAIIVFTKADLFSESQACRALLERNARLFRRDSEEDSSLGFRVTGMTHSSEELDVAKLYGEYRRRTRPIDLIDENTYRAIAGALPGYFGRTARKYPDETPVRLPEHLVRQFLEAADACNVERLRELVDSGFPADFVDPRTGWTLLHHAAASKSWRLLEFAMSTGRCDYLAHDRWGRYPSWVANDPTVGDGRTDGRMWKALRNKEEDLAAERGLDYDPLPPSDGPAPPGW